MGVCSPCRWDSARPTPRAHRAPMPPEPVQARSDPAGLRRAGASLGRPHFPAALVRGAGRHGPFRKRSNAVTTLDWIVVALYFVLTFAVAIVVTRRAKT